MCPIGSLEQLFRGHCLITSPVSGMIHRSLYVPVALPSSLWNLDIGRQIFLDQDFHALIRCQAAFGVDRAGGGGDR